VVSATHTRGLKRPQLLRLTRSLRRVTLLRSSGLEHGATNLCEDARNGLVYVVIVRGSPG
jgi:hypothetical protein